MYTRTCFWTLSRARWIQSTHSCPVSWRPNLILSSTYAKFFQGFSFIQVFWPICWTHFCYFPCILSVDLCQPSWFNQFSNILLKHANYRVPHYVVFSVYFMYIRFNFVQPPSPHNAVKASNLKTCISTMRTRVLTSLWPHVEPNNSNNISYLKICGMQLHDLSACISGTCLSLEDTETSVFQYVRLVHS